MESDKALRGLQPRRKGQGFVVASHTPLRAWRLRGASDRLFRPDATPPWRMKSPVYNSSEQRSCGSATMFLHRIDLNVSSFRQIALNDDILGAYRELF
jgi:ribosomal protein S14